MGRVIEKREEQTGLAAQAYAELKNCEWISFVFLFCGGLWALQRHNAPQIRENKDKGNEEQFNSAKHEARREDSSNQTTQLNFFNN